MPELACPTGSTSSPVGGFANTLQWSAVSFINGVVLEGLNPILGPIAGVFAPQLFSVNSLCANPPPVPAGITDNNLLRAIGDLTHFAPYDPRFMIVLNEYIQYGMFEHFCQCSPMTISTPGVPCYTEYYSVIGSSLPTAACVFPVDGCSYYPGATAHAWPTGGANLMQFTILPGSAQPPFNVDWYSSASTTHIVIPFTDIDIGFAWSADVSAYAASTDPGWSLALQGHVETGGPGPGPVDQFNFKIDYFPPSGGSCTTPTTPKPPPPPVITAAAPPTLVCDSATICTVQYAILNATQDANISLNLQQPISRYVLGAVHDVSSSGEIAVAADLVGALVTIESSAPGTGYDVSDPPRYYESGWITFENTNGWTPRQAVLHSPEVMLTNLQSVTRIGFNCQMSTSMQITELVRG